MLERFALFTNISVSDNSIIDNALFLLRNIQVAFEGQCERNYCIHKKIEFIQPEFDLAGLLRKKILQQFFTYFCYFHDLIINISFILEIVLEII